MTDPIVKTVTVKCSPHTAFDVFVNQTSSWWPLSAHAVSAGVGKAALAVTIEAHVGGAVYETMHDGARAEWGEVLECEPGRKLAITWHPGTNPNAPTRVDVDFSDAGAGMCTVTLTHSGWEAWAEEANARRDSYNGGWDHVFGVCFAGAFAA